jgi:hypothetical protein
MSQSLVTGRCEAFVPPLGFAVRCHNSEVKTQSPTSGQFQVAGFHRGRATLCNKHSIGRSTNRGEADERASQEELEGFHRAREAPSRNPIKSH